MVKRQTAKKTDSKKDRQQKRQTAKKTDSKKDRQQKRQTAKKAKSGKKTKRRKRCEEMYEDFDHLFYISEYLDLSVNGVRNREKALQHFSSFGEREGRYRNRREKEEKSFSFFLTSHVNSEETNQYWIEAYNCIRKFYKEEYIFIIQDNCDMSFFSIPYPLHNCVFIESEFPGRGEILAYYYFFKIRKTPIAIILHDSSFIQSKLSLTYTKTIDYLWDFTLFHHKEDEERMLLSSLKEQNKLFHIYDNVKWKGCFGLQSVVNLSFIDELVKTYDLFNLLNHVQGRSLRCAMERVFSIICISHDATILKKHAIYGDISSMGWGRTFSSYREKKRDPGEILKVWTGR
jgi:hypothetical protein